MLRKCKTCGFLDSASSKCRLTGRQKDPNADYCSEHNDSPYKCMRCGSIMLDPNIDIIDGEAYIFCDRCFNEVLGCAGCENAKECLFETDPSPLPKLVQQQIRQGNSIFTTTIRNPARMDITCVKCGCYEHPTDPSKLGQCLREQGWCSKYNGTRDFPLKSMEGKTENGTD